MYIPARRLTVCSGDGCGASADAAREGPTMGGSTSSNGIETLRSEPPSRPEPTRQSLCHVSCFCTKPPGRKCVTANVVFECCVPRRGVRLVPKPKPCPLIVHLPFPVPASQVQNASIQLVCRRRQGGASLCLWWPAVVRIPPFVFLHPELRPFLPIRGPL